MNTSDQHINERAVSHTVEQRLGKLGSEIDALIHRAQQAKERLIAEEKSLQNRGAAACNELSVALEDAWDDLHQVWKDLAHGVNRVHDALHGRVMKDEYFNCTGLDEND